MKIIEKISAKNKDIRNNPAPTIVFLGDSVTEGCFKTHNDFDAAYHNRVRQKLNFLFPDGVVNIINAGIGGTTAAFGAERVERDVLVHNPDLCVVCFGLNDAPSGDDGLEIYKKSLAEIFQKLKENGSEIIFMTPNMMNTRFDDVSTPEQHKSYAKETLKIQTGGMMDKYMSAAKEVAAEYNVPVCDCYSRWKRLEKYGVDTTKLLGNRINHPKREMHELFAISLLETMFN